MGMKTRGNIALFTLALVLSGCGGSSAPDLPATPDIPAVPEVNTPPALVVMAPTQIINAQQETVTLAITASDDKSVASYSWSQTAGIPVTLIDATTASAHFDTPVVNHDSADQLLEFQIIVTDSENATTSAQLSVTIKPNNHIPTVTTAAVADVHSGDTVQLTADAIDVDGTIANYHWQQLSGTSVTINNADTSNPSFVAPQTEMDETLSFEITVTDDKQASSTASVNVNVGAALQVPPELVTLPKITTKSGAYTSIEWEVSSTDPQVTVTVSQTGQHDDLTIVMTDQNKAYFTAPEVATTTQIRTLKLTATDNEGQSTAADIEVEIQPSTATIYPQSKTIHTFVNQGHDIDEFDVADMNGDGISDIITREVGGSFWYKNKGNLDIDFTPNKMLGEVNSRRRAFELLEDINGDGSIDLVIYQLGAQGFGLYLQPNDGSGNFTSTELIGYLPQANDYITTRDIRVTTFTTANTSGKYIIVALSNSLYVFAPSPAGYTLISNKSFENKRPAIASITACDLKQNGNADLFFQLIEHEAGAGTEQSSLHVLSGDDNYQTDTQIDESALYDTAFACLPSGDKQRLIQYRREDNNGVTVEISYDDSQSTYRAIEFESAIASSKPYTNEFIQLDVNGDQIDDLVALDRNGKKTKVFTRSNSTSLRFSSRNSLCDCDITPWAETSDYRQFSQINNTFWLSDKLAGGNPNDDDSGNRVNFTALTTSRSLNIVGSNFIIEQTDANGELDYSVFKLLEGQLTQNMSFDMTLFDHGLPKMVDFNNDGKLDALYSYSKPNNDNNSTYGDLLFALRLANDTGYDSEKVLFSMLDSVERPSFRRIKDINGDGHLDISLIYDFGVLVEGWRLYDVQSDSYIASSNGGLFVSDVDSHNSSFHRGFEDFDGNNLNDIFRLDELNVGCAYRAPYEYCGTLQVNMQHSPGQFGQWIDVDPQKMFFERYMFADINQDGSQNLFIKGRPLSGDGDNAYTILNYWYQFDQDGTITKHQANTMPNNIADIYGTGQPYLVDFNNTRKMTIYQYSALAKMPVPSEIQKLPMNLGFLPRFVDIDKDLDMDIITYDGEHIYLIENKVK